MQPYELTISQQSILPLHTDKNCFSMKLYFTVLSCCYMSVDFKLFFYQGFHSQTLTIHRTAGEGRGPSFIPLYHFHPLTNVEIFICNFACEMTVMYF